MAYKETFWMACDSTEQMRAEYGPFHSRAEAEIEARKLGFGFLLRYEHIIGDNEDIQEVRCVFIELPPGPIAVPRASFASCTPAAPVAVNLPFTMSPGRLKFGPTSMSLSTRAIVCAFRTDSRRRAERNRRLARHLRLSRSRRRPSQFSSVFRLHEPDSQARPFTPLKMTKVKRTHRAPRDQPSVPTLIRRTRSSLFC